MWLRSASAFSIVFDDSSPQSTKSKSKYFCLWLRGHDNSNETCIHCMNTPMSQNSLYSVHELVVLPQCMLVPSWWGTKENGTLCFGRPSIAPRSNFENGQELGLARWPVIGYKALYAGLVWTGIDILLCFCLLMSLGRCAFSLCFMVFPSSYHCDYSPLHQ